LGALAVVPPGLGAACFGAAAFGAVACGAIAMGAEGAGVCAAATADAPIRPANTRLATLAGIKPLIISCSVDAMPTQT
jgi:hypothetical protein